MNRKMLLIVSLLVCALAPLIAWATCGAVGVDERGDNLEQQGNLFPNTLDLFIAEGSGSGCSTITSSCGRDCCYAFEDCHASCDPFDLQCRLGCLNDNYACENECHGTVPIDLPG